MDVVRCMLATHTSTNPLPFCNLECKGSNGGTVVRALASHQYGPSSNPRINAICGLSLMLVLFFVPRDFYGSREGTIQKYFANPKKYFKSQFFSQITVEKFDKSKKLLQILRKFVDPQITFSIIGKYFANP